MKGIINNNNKLRDYLEMNMNNFFKYIKIYCNDLKKENFIYARKLLDMNKKDIIIFEADIDKIDLSIIDIKKSGKLLMPTDKIFIEIPKWIIKTDTHILENSGGIFIFNDKLEDRDTVIAYTLWIVTNKLTGKITIKPLSLMFFDAIHCSNYDKNIPDNMYMKMGSVWKNNLKNGIESMNDDFKKELMTETKKILYYLLHKIEKKEYGKYKKWTPQGFTEHDIIYSYEVSKHKRHFWEDSGRFNIPRMSEYELKEKGYLVDELVFRDGELRKNVPYTIIGNFLVGDVKEIKEDNRRIKLAKGRIWRQEEKIYKILRELYPDKIIRRHDRKTLKGIELDFNIPELRLGIEYDGEQHFDKELYEKLYGDGFDAQVKRDRKKDRLCVKKNITLIRIKYDEGISKRLIKSKIKSKQTKTI